MNFSQEIESFIKDYVKELDQGTASIFAGAGLSIPAGFVNWSELMREIAHDVGLDIDCETDLISIAQFHVNENQNRTKISKKILEEFVEDTEETDNHRIIATLPVSSVWTTNYDTLIEQSFLNAGKVPDTKFTEKQLLINRQKRDVIVYKMHGDVAHPHDAILTKEQYEQYHRTHEGFINALTGELTTKTFLFLGFSFTDPNLDYVLSRLNYRLSSDKKQHYCILKKHVLGDVLSPDQATLEYNLRKQALVINDLKRYGIKSLLVEDYVEIKAILTEIRNRFKMRSIFVSGSAEKYDPYSRFESVEFIHRVSKKLIESNYRIVNGFGWGVGSAVINGALEAIHSKPLKFSESQLVLRPFPQYKTGDKELAELWEEYRHRMISLCGIGIFLFGNKDSDGKIVDANGVIREFEISAFYGNYCIPVACTGYAAAKIHNTIMDSLSDYFPKPEIAKIYLEKLSNLETKLQEKESILVEFINELTK